MLTGDFKDERLRAIADEPVTAYAVEPGDLERTSRCVPGCGGELEVVASVYVDDLEAFTTAACRRCDYIQRAVTPNEQWFLKAAALLDAYESFRLPDVSFEAARAETYRERLRFLLSRVHVKAALEVGAGFGAGVGVLKASGFEVDALEPDPHRARYIRDAYPSVSVTALTVEQALRRDTPHRHYELVMVCHVLEHCRNPVYVLANLPRWLEPGGLLYIEIPVAGTINWSDAFYLAHMSNWSVSCFLRFLETTRTGLRVVDTIFYPHAGGHLYMGVLLAPNSGTGMTYIDRPAGSLKGLYRHGLPVAVPTGKPLRYRTPRFDHYLYGLRFDRYAARYDGDFIVMVDDA